MGHSPSFPFSKGLFIPLGICAWVAYLGLFCLYAYKWIFCFWLKNYYKFSTYGPHFQNVYSRVLFTPRIWITGGMPTGLTFPGVSRHKDLNSIMEKVILKLSIQAWHNVTVSLWENMGDTEERILSTTCICSWAMALSHHGWDWENDGGREKMAWKQNLKNLLSVSLSVSVCLSDLYATGNSLTLVSIRKKK